jgi:hypothetical protein
MSTNRRILIDNATLSGVERITGVSKTLNLNYIDNDILCLEKLITAILFSDQLVAIDDYKDTYRSDRLKRFDFVDFTKLASEKYAHISDEAAKFVREMTFSFSGSKPAGDVVNFFESLRVDPQLRWDAFVSSEYLTLSYLVEDSKLTPYERSIDSAFRNENVDREQVDADAHFQPTIGVAGRPDIQTTKDLVRAFSSTNPQSRGEDGKSALDRLVFGYGWAAERSHFYNGAASLLNADVYLAPLRDAFCESCMRIDYPSQVRSLLDRLKSKSQDTLARILEPSGRAPFAIRLPFFTAYMISKSANPSECIKLAMRLRDTDDFKECRIIFHNLDHLSTEDSVKEVNGILTYLDQSCTKLMGKFGISTDSGAQFSLSVGITGVNVGGTLKLNQLFRNYKNRSFTRVFRNMAQDMVNVERLGGLYDKVRSSVREHADATYPRISATPKFMEDRANEYGRPAEF